MESQQEPFSLVLFSGNDDKYRRLQCLAPGAAIGYPVHLLSGPRGQWIDGLEEPAGPTTALLKSQGADTLLT